MASNDGAPSYTEAERQSSVVAAAGLSSEDDAAVLGKDTALRVLPQCSPETDN